MKKIRKLGTLWLAFLWVIIALLALGGATYAWFQFNPVTTVDPMSSTISAGETTLYIGDRIDGEFTEECALPQFVNGTFEPVSTADLNNFYRSSLQDRNGISIQFKNTTDSIDTKMMHGKLYLKSLKDGCDVFFYRPGMNIGGDAQTLAALRLGLKFTTSAGTKTYIFALNQMGNTTGAEAIQTIAENGRVVAGINSDNTPNFALDSALEIGSYCAEAKDINDRYPRAGANELCTIHANEIAEVEYWLYLEGCDPNCTNQVQNKDIVLQLSFAGVTRE